MSSTARENKGHSRSDLLQGQEGLHADRNLLLVRRSDEQEDTGHQMVKKPDYPWSLFPEDLRTKSPEEFVAYFREHPEKMTWVSFEEDGVVRREPLFSVEEAARRLYEQR